MVDDGRTTDGRRTDDGRTPDHGHPISSPCEPDGSGELISNIHETRDIHANVMRHSCKYPETFVRHTGMSDDCRMSENDPK